jgi:hypothetical protein
MVKKKYKDIPKYMALRSLSHSSFPTATYLKSKGLGCPIEALMEPHFEVGLPLANSIPSRTSYKYNQDWK